MRNIWLDGIMGVIVGDALGLPVQFTTREELDEEPLTDMVGYGTFNLPAGSWSDDSSLTLATLDSIQRNDGIYLRDIMQNFADWLLDGYFTPFGFPFDQGSTCVKAIYAWIRKNNVDECGMTGEYANGNGALMRIMPVCLYGYEKVKSGEWSEEYVVEQVQKVSTLTHNHLRSQIACGIYYFLAKAIIDESGSLKERMQIGMDNALEFYRKDVTNRPQLSYFGRMYDLDEFAKIPRKDIKSSGYVLDTIEAAVWCLLKNENYKDAMLMAANLGYDTDTVAAIAGGLAGLYYGYEGIPKEWVEVIQKREWICNLLIAQGER